VVDCWLAPEVPVTVMLNVPAGVPPPPPPPPPPPLQPEMLSTSSSTRRTRGNAVAARRQRSGRRAEMPKRREATKVAQRSAKATNQRSHGAASGQGREGDCGAGGTAERAVVEMVSVVEAGFALGVTEVGLKAQEDSVGRPVQEKVMALGKPPAWGVTLI